MKELEINRFRAKNDNEKWSTYIFSSSNLFIFQNRTILWKEVIFVTKCKFVSKFGKNSYIL